VRIWHKACKNKRNIKRTILILKTQKNLLRTKAIKRKEKTKEEAKMDRKMMEEMAKIMVV
jgi:hypothetical protein